MPTWTGAGATNNWSDTGNWDTGAIPTAATTAIFNGVAVNGNKDCTVNTTARVCSQLNFTGYTGTITMTFGITVSGNVTLGAGMTIAGAGNLALNATGATYTSNGKTWPNSITLNANSTITDISTITGDLTLSPSTNALYVYTFNANVTCRDLIYAAIGVQQLNGSNIYINRNLTILSTNGSSGNLGTTNLVMQGTGTWSGGAARFICNNLEFIGGANTITISGSVAFSSKTLKYTSGVLSVSGSTIFVQGTSTLTSNGITWNNFNFQNTTTTLSDNATINNFTTTVGGIGVTLNTNTLNIQGDLSIGIATGGTTTLNINGTGNQTWSGTAGGGSFTNNLIINKATGNLILSGTVVYGNTSGTTLTHTFGTISPGTSTFQTVGGTTFNINSSGFILYNWSPSFNVTNQTHTINTGAITVNNDLLLNGTTIFAGTAEWTTQNFTHAGAGFTCTLQAGNTYTVNGIFTMIGTAASRAILQSSNAVAVTANIASLSNQLFVTVGTLTPPAAGYVLGSTSTALPIALNNLLPDRPTIASGAASPYTLVSAIGATALASGSYTLGKKAFLTVTNGTGTTNVAYVTTRDIDSNGGIAILAFASYSDSIGQPSANIFRTLNWGPLIAPSGSVYYTFVN